MNLVGYTTTALSRNDIIDTPTNKNVVDGAIVELKDYDGNLVTIYDDINGTNPETQRRATQTVNAPSLLRLAIMC